MLDDVSYDPSHQTASRPRHPSRQPTRTTHVSQQPPRGRISALHWIHGAPPISSQHTPTHIRYRHGTLEDHAEPDRQRPENEGVLHADRAQPCLLLTQPCFLQLKSDNVTNVITPIHRWLKSFCTEPTATTTYTNPSDPENPSMPMPTASSLHIHSPCLPMIGNPRSTIDAMPITNT